MSEQSTSEINEYFDEIKNNTELVTPEEFSELLTRPGKKTGYIGFEPSGLAHIGWLVCGGRVKKLISAGIDMSILLADWHAYINDKLAGNIEDIRICGKYMEDVFSAMGINDVSFVYASDMISDPRYWELVLKVGKNTSMSRVKRAMTIMGRVADESEADTSKFFYPLMQVADMFYMNVDVALGGMDQRKAHMLARDVAEKLGLKKPMAIHTPLIPALTGVQGRMEVHEAKMSKSNPDSSISLHDDEDTIKKKMKKAYCPMGELAGNPVIEIFEHIIFQWFDEVVIERPEKFGGNLTFKSSEELKKAFSEQSLHPMDLKSCAASFLDKIITPVREYFLEHPQNYEKVKSIIDSKKSNTKG